MFVAGWVASVKLNRVVIRAIIEKHGSATFEKCDDGRVRCREIVDAVAERGAARRVADSPVDVDVQREIDRRRALRNN